MLVDYTSTWAYGYDFMLDAAQVIIDTDFKEQLNRVATGVISGAAQIERIEEAVANGNVLRKCPNISQECGVLILSGMSSVMGVPLQFMFYNQLNHVRVFCPSKTFFEKHGEHVLDNYMNSIEIKAYCLNAERTTKAQFEK